ncbi:hypothetical protein [Perlucidibaca aquatica]|jgi:hypothetical protein|nr:hypothetical protein [Perlucidibaca aquatica]
MGLTFIGFGESAQVYTRRHILAALLMALIFQIGKDGNERLVA